MAVPAGRGGAHRRHLRLHGAAAPRARGKAQGQRLPHARRSTRSWRCEPDCVFGFSDLQADIAARAGAQGRAGHHLQPAQRGGDLLHAVPGGGDGGPRRRRPARCWKACARGCWQIEAAGRALPRRPRVYFEEWDEPHISAIRWVSELVGIAGGDDCFPELARAVAGQGPHHRRRRRDRAAQSRHRRRLLVRQEVPPREGRRARRAGRT